MSKIETFEDIIAWQKTRLLCNIVFELINKDKFYKDFALRDQINRSSGSGMDNIAEGFERGGNKEFIQFLYISKGSTGEVKSQLHRALDRNYISTEEFEKAYNLANETGKLVSGLINYLSNTKLKGEKLKD